MVEPGFLANLLGVSEPVAQWLRFYVKALADKSLRHMASIAFQHSRIALHQAHSQWMQGHNVKALQQLLLTSIILLCEWNQRPQQACHQHGNTIERNSFIVFQQENWVYGELGYDDSSKALGPIHTHTHSLNVCSFMKIRFETSRK